MTHAPAPRPPCSAASYSARIRALYSAVNTRRLGRSARGPMAPSSTAPSAKVIVIGCYSLLTPCKGRNSVVVSHHSLTHRDPARWGAFVMSTGALIAAVERAGPALV